MASLGLLPQGDAADAGRSAQCPAMNAMPDFSYLYGILVVFAIAVCLVVLYQGINRLAAIGNRRLTWRWPVVLSAIAPTAAPGGEDEGEAPAAIAEPPPPPVPAPAAINPPVERVREVVKYVNPVVFPGRVHISRGGECWHATPTCVGLHNRGQVIHSVTYRRCKYCGFPPPSDPTR